MIKIPVAEAKNRFSELIALVESGEEVTLTRRGTLVARLVRAEPANKKAQQAKVAGAFARLAMLRKLVRLEGDLKSIAREGLD
jgi:prevent-host-death family protein